MYEALFRKPEAVAELLPSPYELVFVESIAAPCIWITRTRSPAPTDVADPRLAPRVTVVFVVPALMLDCAGWYVSRPPVAVVAPVSGGDAHSGAVAADVTVMPRPTT